MSEIEDIVASHKREIERQHAEIDAMRAIIRKHTGIEAEPRELSTWPYLLSLIRAHPRELLDAPEYVEAVKAMRTLANVLPILRKKAEFLAKEAERAGRTTWLDRYAEHACALERSIKPFVLGWEDKPGQENKRGRRDKRGWWHGWAKMAATEIRLILSRHGRHAGFHNETDRAVEILVDLLEMAGHRTTHAAVIGAISK